MSKILKILEKEIEPKIIEKYGKFYVYENVREFLREKYKNNK